MEAITITARDELGKLWLPWYIRRDDPGRLVYDIHRDHAAARSLRVREVIEHAGVREALKEKTAYAEHGPWSHLEGIAHRRRDLDVAAPIGPILAWSTAEGLLLRDGCHRSCALFELAPQDFELRIDVSDPPPGAIDAISVLRSGS
ncbi:MAG: hypothetical protein WD844_07955 [Thermoleophilaceae bacterium]